MSPCQIRERLKREKNIRAFNTLGSVSEKEIKSPIIEKRIHTFLKDVVYLSGCACLIILWNYGSVKLSKEELREGKQLQYIDYMIILFRLL